MPCSCQNMIPSGCLSWVAQVSISAPSCQVISTRRFLYKEQVKFDLNCCPLWLASVQGSWITSDSLFKMKRVRGATTIATSLGHNHRDSTHATNYRVRKSAESDIASSVMIMKKVVTVVCRDLFFGLPWWATCCQATPVADITLLLNDQ